jgi:hypothetical protein
VTGRQPDRSASTGQRGRAALRRRLRSLALGELAAALVFAWLAVGQRPGGSATRVGIALLVFLLVQGSAWWWYRLILLGRGRRGSRFPTGLQFATLFLDRFNLAVLATAAPVVVLVAGGWWDLFLGSAFLLFAVLEYVNYFRVRLSYGRLGFNIREFRRTPLRISAIRKVMLRGGSGEGRFRSKATPPV